MIDGRSVLAIVPARGGSKGLKRKNLRPLAGKPLLSWPVSAALDARTVDRVIVSTEDPEIADAARAAGADIPFMRPTELASDTAGSADVVCHALGALREQGDTYDYLILLEPTSPLTESSDVDGALEHLHSARDRADAIVGIARLEGHHPEYNMRLDARGLIQPYASARFAPPVRRQDVEDVYFIEGSLYASAADVFIERRSFCHERTLGYPVPRWKAFEVDELMDLICIEALMARRGELAAE